MTGQVIAAQIDVSAVQEALSSTTKSLKINKRAIEEAGHALCCSNAAREEGTQVTFHGAELWRAESAFDG